MVKPSYICLGVGLGLCLGSVAYIKSQLDKPLTSHERQILINAANYVEGYNGVNSNFLLSSVRDNISNITDKKISTLKELESKVDLLIKENNSQNLDYLKKGLTEDIRGVADKIGVRDEVYISGGILGLFGIPFSLLGLYLFRNKEHDTWD